MSGGSAPLQHDPTATRSPREAADFHRLDGYRAIRARYLRAGLGASAVINGLGLLDTHAAWPMQLTRALLLAFSLVCLPLLRRDPPQLGQVVAFGLWAGALVFAWLRCADGWPTNLLLLPALLVFSTLAGGTRVAAGLAGTAIALVTAAYACGLAPSPPFLSVQLTNWVLSIVLLHLFVRQLAKVLSEGAAELAASAVAMEEAQRTAAELTRALSSRVARAVDELAAAVERDPLTAGPVALRLSEVLDVGRRAVPPEPKVPDAQLKQRLELLRQQAMSWTVRVGAALAAIQLVRNLLLGVWVVAAAATILLLVCCASLVLRARRPAWADSSYGALILVAYLSGAIAMVSWISHGTTPPPNLVTWLMGTVIVTVTMGPRFAFALLGLGAILCLAGLAFYPGMPWVIPVNLAIGYAMLCWIVWRWPRELLEVLVAQRDAAAAQLRERRRLVATFFHDLANPQLVVVYGLDALAEDGAQPHELARVKSMVARMQATLKSAISGRVELRVVAVHQLSEDLRALFRERLQRKGIEFSTTGQLDGSVRCDEALLRDSVLANLLSNALKFSPSGAAKTLTVKREGGRVGLFLEDRGPGLPPEVSAAVERGQRAPSAVGSAGETGSGYGLMLARDYVVSMGGSLELTPREGGGLSARLWLPAG